MIIIVIVFIVIFVIGILFTGILAVKMNDCYLDYVNDDVDVFNIEVEEDKKL